MKLRLPFVRIESKVTSGKWKVESLRSVSRHFLLATFNFQLHPFVQPEKQP